MLSQLKKKKNWENASQNELHLQSKSFLWQLYIIGKLSAIVYRSKTILQLYMY